MEFLLPPNLYTQNGSVRTAGFEIEFGEIDISIAASCIIESYGGKLHQHNKFYQEVLDTAYGNFSISIDAQLLTNKSYEKIWEKFGIDPKEIFFGENTIETDLENTLESIASLVVPHEIGTPPIPMNQLSELELLRKALFRKKAKGTKSSVFYAYATHINPELPVCDTSTLLNYTRAFLLLYPWLSQMASVSFTRKLTTFIKPFPQDYISLVLARSYDPDLKKFIADYYKYNSSRNRPFDLYPVFAFMDKAALEPMTDSIGKVNARPTFHYRVPNSMVDDPTWSLAKEWNLWIEVEKLAANPENIMKLSEEYLQMEEDVWIRFKNKWITRINTWINAEK